MSIPTEGSWTKVLLDSFDWHTNQSKAKEASGTGDSIDEMLFGMTLASACLALYEVALSEDHFDYALPASDKVLEKHLSECDSEERKAYFKAVGRLTDRLGG